FTDQNAPAGQYTYNVASLIRIATGEVVIGELSNPVTVQTRPFNLVAVGDSIMWGQGLLPAHKFSTGVQQWIAGQLANNVSPVDVRAHSGAVTYPAPGQPLMEDTMLPGEIPSDWPTISHQLGLAGGGGADPLTVDLLLLDGCINNVGVLTILNPAASDDAL